jgi:hypothetical protein
MLRPPPTRIVLCGPGGAGFFVVDSSTGLVRIGWRPGTPRRNLKFKPIVWRTTRVNARREGFEAAEEWPFTRVTVSLARVDTETGS